MINEFIKNFADDDILCAEKIGKKYYLSSEELKSVSLKTEIVPDSIGVYLGEEKKGKFYATIALIDIISKHSKRKIVIDSRSEWLFLCGRDIMAGSILKANVGEGLVLIQNEKDENLGLGMIIEDLNSNSKRIVIKNILDKGDFLRREMD